MDVLADVLQVMNLRSRVKFSMELTAPWGIESPSFGDNAVFYIVKRGSCYLESEAFPGTISLTGGDLVMLPHGGKHILRDQPGSPAHLLSDCVKKCINHPAHQSFKHGGGGALTALVAGQFIVENGQMKSFLSSLPGFIHLHDEYDQHIETTLKWMAVETNSDNPGSKVMLAHLTDILFIQILRDFMAQYRNRKECETATGWLRAMADPNIGKAFELIHDKPQHPWTVAELAGQVNMSRTAFSVRFTQLCGIPPLSYLTRWRMIKAGEMLRHSNDSMYEIASLVGYESEAAFGKAFKREMGIAPGTYRKTKSVNQDIPFEIIPGDHREVVA